jgi:hypothetical protein
VTCSTRPESWPTSSRPTTGPGGAFKAKTYPVVGNHEYLGGDGAAGYGVYRLIMYPDRWIGAFKGVDGNTYDRTGQRCH